jgi:hypothetical protein
MREIPLARDRPGGRQVPRGRHGPAPAGVGEVQPGAGGPPLSVTPTSFGVTVGTGVGMGVGVGTGVASAPGAGSGLSR